MVTTRMTEAVPMTIPRPVSSDRTGFALRAWTLNFSASARNNLAPLRHPEELLRVGPGGILGRQLHGHVTLEEILCNLKILLLLNQYLCLGVDHLRHIWTNPLRFSQILI